MIFIQIRVIRMVYLFRFYANIRLFARINKRRVSNFISNSLNHLKLHTKVDIQKIQVRICDWQSTTRRSWFIDDEVSHLFIVTSLPTNPENRIIINVLINVKWLSWLSLFAFISFAMSQQRPAHVCCWLLAHYSPTKAMINWESKFNSKTNQISNETKWKSKTKERKQREEGDEKLNEKHNQSTFFHSFVLCLFV